VAAVFFQPSVLPVGDLFAPHVEGLANSTRPPHFAGSGAQQTPFVLLQEAPSLGHNVALELAFAIIPAASQVGVSPHADFALQQMVPKSFPALFVAVFFQRSVVASSPVAGKAANLEDPHVVPVVPVPVIIARPPHFAGSGAQQTPSELAQDAVSVEHFVALELAFTIIPAVVQVGESPQVAL
jgi:hypothetical protein